MPRCVRGWRDAKDRFRQLDAKYMENVWRDAFYIHGSRLKAEGMNCLQREDRNGGHYGWTPKENKTCGKRPVVGS